jgi:hypothetical protein
MSSQLTQPRVTAAPHDRAIRNVIVAGLAALVAAGAIALVLAVTKDSSSSNSSRPAVSASRPDSGPSESSVAAAVGRRPVAGPSETRVAASLRDGRVQLSDGPNEARTAAAVAGR